MKKTSTKPAPQLRILRGIFFIALGLLMAVSSARAALTSWLGTTGSWSDSANWDGGIAPSPTTGARLGNNGTAQFTNGASETIESLTIGHNAPSAFPGTGALEITSGALTITNGTSIGTTDSGTLSISGSGASLVEQGPFFSVGFSGHAGEITVGNGGTLTVSGSKVITGNAVGAATINLNGTTGARGTFATTGFTKNGGTFSLNWNGGVLKALAAETNFFNNQFQAGDVTLDAGGGFFDTNGFNVSFEANAPSSLRIDGSGGFTKLGTGTLTMALSNTYSGGTTILGGTLAISQNANLGAVGTGITLDDGTLQINGSFALDRPINLSGIASPGTIEVASGQTVTQAEAITGVGNLVKSGDGQFTLTAVSNFYVTRVAAGTLAIQSGGSISNPTAFIGVGTVSGQTGTLSIGADGMATSDTVIIGNGGTGIANVSGTGAHLEGTQGLIIGQVSNGTLNVTAGGKVDASGFGGLSVGYGSVIGLQGVATVNGTDSILNASSVTVGGGGSGTLNLEAGGVLRRTTAGGMTLANSAGITGTLNIGTGGAAGNLENVTAINLGSGAGIVNFNHTGSATFSPNITGGIAVNKLASGTTTLTGTSTYTGATDIQTGSFIVNGSLGNTAVTVRSSATLGGTGSIAGGVTVANGGTLAPGNSPGTLTVGSLSLSNNSFLNFELGSPTGTPGVDSDLVNVTGNLLLDGILNLTNAGGFGIGTYKIFEYGGSLNNQGLVYGIVPGAFDLSIDTTVANEVRLIVTAGQGQYWDGANLAPTGVPGGNGGSGTWSNDVTQTNWTTADGNSNGAWTGAQTAFFGGTAGTVDVADSVNVSELRFLTDGYLLNGAGELAISGSTLTILADTGVSAEIATVISGSGGLLKNGGGTLALTGTNTYAGGTEVVSGTLLVGDDAALGSGPLTLANGTTFGAVSGTAVVLNSDVDVTINGDISLQVDNTSFLEIGGTVDLGSSTRTLTSTEDGSFVCFMGDIQGSGAGLTLLAATGTNGEFMFCGMDSNTYTGLTTVGNGVTLTLNKDPGLTAVAGNLEVQTGGKVVLMDFPQINAASTVTVNGTLEIDALDPFSQTIGNLQGSGTITNVLDAATLEIRAGNFSGSIGETDPLDALAIVKSGSGQLTLNAASTYSGGTTIDAGILRTTHASALGSGNVALNSGGTLNPVGTLTIATLTWNGGTVALALGTAVNFLEITGDLTLTGIGVFNFVQASGFLPDTEYRILSADNLDTFLASQFSANVLEGVTTTFRVDAATDALYVSFSGANQGLVIQNRGPYFTPLTADFLVTGAAQTGGPTDNNTINSLAFVPGSSLQVFNVLTLTSGKVTVAAGSASLSGGTVFAPNTFTKLGAGELDLQGNVVVNGAATVQAGALLVNGQFSANGLTVSPGAMLGGSGFIVGNVFNNGTLSPGNSPGTLTIAGNLTLNRGSTTQLEVESLSVFDQIVVSGLATLGGTLDVVPYNGYDFEFGQQFNFLSAGEVAGTFDNVTMPEGFRGRVLVNGGSVTLVAAPASYTQVATNQNQLNVAAALDSYISATSGGRLTVSAALDLLSEEQYPAAFDQISPAFYQTLTSTTIEQYNAQGQFLQQRFSSAALGRQAGFNQYGTQAPVLNEKSGGKAVANAKDIVEATPDNQWGIWTLGNGIFANSSLASVSNYRSQSGGFLVGGDYRLGDSLVAGVFGGYQGTVSRYDNGGRTTINAARFGAYASYNPGSGFYANTVVGGGYSAYDVKRPIQFGSVNRAANSAPGGAEFVSQLTTGYDWKAGGFTFGPVGGLQYTYAGVGGFGETGAESLNLKMGQQNANSLRTTLGARVAYTWVVTDKIAIIPEVRMSWQHEFLMNPTGMSAALDGGNGPGFGYTTSAPARDAVFAGAGVTLQVGDRWNANFYYNADFGRSDYNSQMISGGLGVSF